MDRIMHKKIFPMIIRKFRPKTRKLISCLYAAYQQILGSYFKRKIAIFPLKNLPSHPVSENRWMIIQYRAIHLTAICFLNMSLITLAHSATTHDLPASLPSPQDTLFSTTNTPEYVVIKPEDEITFSSDTAAVISDVIAREGNQFQIGDILLQLDCRIQQADLKKALALQSETAMAQKSAKKLQSYGSLSEFELAKANADAESANADVDKLRAIVDKCVIRAPFNGSVADVFVHAHESVKPGDPLLKIVNTQNLKFEMQIPSNWLSWLHIGSVFSVHINETNTWVPAKITKINPQIEPVSQSVKIIATIDPKNATLLPGMSGQASFPENPLNKIQKNVKQP